MQIYGLKQYIQQLFYILLKLFFHLYLHFKLILSFKIQ